MGAEASRFDDALRPCYVLLRIIDFGLNYFLMLDLGYWFFAKFLLSVGTRWQRGFVSYYRSFMLLLVGFIRIAVFFIR